MKLTTTDNVRAAERDLDALLQNIRTAQTRAVNTLIDQAEVAGNRKIAELYGVPVRTMDKYTTLGYARPGELEASITVKGKGFPLSVFKPVQTKTGVAVTIKGRRIVIPHAFMVDRFGSHVFARGAYGGKGGIKPTGEKFGRFAFGRGRLPINELYSWSPADAAGNPEVTQARDDRVEEQSRAVLERELRAVARGF